MKPLNLSTSLIATLGSQGRGVAAINRKESPRETLELYEMEGCPFCRLVREVLTELDLDAMIYPCPKGGLRYRPMVETMGGKMQFPFLYDPNTDTGIYDSQDIINYLFRNYGEGKKQPSAVVLKGIKTPSSAFASAIRAGKGLNVRPSRHNSKPLTLYSFDASPFARPVRELLCELELFYELKQVGRTEKADWLLPAMRKRLAPDYQPTQRNRIELLERSGRVAVPYLVDPNTGEELYESSDIIAYLKDNYAK